MRSRHLTSLAALIGAAVIIGGRAYAKVAPAKEPIEQDTVTASVSGTIRDENGDPLEGVRVSSIKGIVFTNAEGIYRIDGFGLEVCELVASNDGYIPYRVEVPIRDVNEPITKQDLVLSFPRKIRFRYVISPEGKDDFGDPNATDGTAEFLVEKYFPIPPDEIKNRDFKDFVEGAFLSFRVNDDKLTLYNFNPPIFYESLPSSSEEFEAISSVRAGSFKTQVCPPIQKGDIILIDGVKASGYTLKILFEQVQTLKPSEYKPSPKAQPTTLSISHADFPPHLQAILDKRVAELQTNAGICIAGRAKFSDGAPITSGKDIKVNLHHNVDIPLEVYEGGWFIMDGTYESYIAGPEKGFVLRAFGYDPIDASVTILNKEITYVGFEVKKTPPDRLASVKGVVRDVHDRPVEGARIRISFPFAYGGPTPEKITQTDPNGEYSFEGLSGAEYYVRFDKSGYASDSDRFTPPEGGTALKDLKLYPMHKIVIDYVYQADGSRSFTSGNLQTGTIEWNLVKHGVVDFSEGQAKRRGSSDDILLRQEKGVLKFDIFDERNGNGFYDAGAVPFDSVTEAAQTGYITRGRRCKVGHVYVVRTIEEGNYAKFIVKSLEAF
jgi:hypothetical protein